MKNISFSVINKNKIKSFEKIVQVDSDKSISIRAFLIASISENISEVKNVLESEDVFSCISVLRKLGIKIKKIKNKNYLIYGKGLGSFSLVNNSELNCGNSGTLLRLLIGILSTTPNIEVKITGDKSLKKRSMKKLIKLMEEFGASFFPKNKFNLPLKVISSEIPLAINYNTNSSAQLKSAAILSALNAYGTTTINEKIKSRDHTENILKKDKNVFSIKKNKNIIKIFGKKNLSSLKLNVPGDPSSAAFITALTLLNKNSSVKLKNVGLNKRRLGFYKILKKHGAKIKFKNVKKVNNEFVGDIFVKSSKIKPLKVASSFYASSTDEYPIMFAMSSLLSGVSTFYGIKDLANKESNRIIEMKKILNQIGIKCNSNKDKIKIFGTKIINMKKNIIKVPNLGDHRICMSTMILSLLTGIEANINNFETVGTSSPSFLKIIKSLGAKFEIKKKN
ncbi:MAG: 3-phosphoshikimate 1-carboxyvinyltransferase [Pelagibacteraceae bacterium]